MTFTDAMGDKNHREFRRVGGDTVFFWLGTGEERELKQRGEDGVTREARFTWRDYFRTEFEFVAEEVIEVGDEITIQGIGVGRDGATIHDVELIIEGQIHARPRTLEYADPKDCTLIKKGPKVEVYKNVRDMHFVIDDDEVFVKGPFKRMELKEVSK